MNISLHTAGCLVGLLGAAPSLRAVKPRFDAFALGSNGKGLMGLVNFDREREVNFQGNREGGREMTHVSSAIRFSWTTLKILRFRKKHGNSNQG